MEIKSNVYNIVNAVDKKYYNRCYEISYSISNALWTGFKIYANYETEALEILLDILIKNNQESVMFQTINDLTEIYTIDEIDYVIDSDYIQIDNHFLNAGYLNIKECEILIFE